MVDRWTELNNYVEPNFGHGGHCHVHSTVRPSQRTRTRCVLQARMLGCIVRLREFHRECARRASR